jgi:hypothetical protein
MSKKHIASLLSLAKSPITYDTWPDVTKIFDQITDKELPTVVKAFEAATTHWPTRLEGFRTDSSGEPQEWRRAPLSWVAEIYAGKPSEKHQIIRVLTSPRRPLRGQKLENLNSSKQRLSRVRQVSFEQVPITAAFFKAWKGDGPWRQWALVRLWYCGLTPALLKLLAKSELPAMQTLVLTQNRFKAEGAQAIQSATTWTALRALDLCNNQIGDEGAKNLLGALWLKQVERLDLGMNGLTDAGFASLAKELSVLTWLKLTDNALGAKPEAWVKSLPALSHLTIGEENKLTDKSFSKLLEVASPALSSLDLSAGKLGEASAAAIVESKRAFTLLDIVNTKIGVVGITAILEAPALQGLTSLRINASGLNKKNAQLLVDGALPALQSFAWYGDGEDGIDDILKKSPRLVKAAPEGFLDR